MNPLQYFDNPVQQAYGGGETLNSRQLQNALNTISTNFRELEVQLREQLQKLHKLSARVNDLEHYYRWTDANAPETRQAYEAHIGVVKKFDEAGSSDHAYAASEVQA